MAKWQQRSAYLREHFEWTKSRIFCKERPETWWMSARTWNRTADRSQQGNTLAGLHADNILFILDESGGIPDAVMATAEAALASCVDGHIVQAGNPTHLDGPLWRACTSERRLWHVTEITADPSDPKRSTRVKAEWAAQQIEKYGRDNPWVLVNVFGKFPPGSLNTLIGPDECRAAIERAYRPEDIERAPRVLGVDVARFGDDASVIFPRQGLVAFPPHKMRNVDGTQGAGAVARKAADWRVDAIFVDDTGGWGASWIDNLRLLGHAPIGVGFAARPNDPRYENKRTEMYFEAVQWIKNGGSMPDIPELVAAFQPLRFRNIDGSQGAGAVARKWQDWQADAVFIDDTGGWGASWIDNLRLLGHAPIGIGFASRPDDPRYDNKRTEMYFEAVNWIRAGGAIPDSPELIAALSQTTYSFRGDRLLLEPKDEVKKRLGYSPDDADAFALTFAQKVAGRPVYYDRTMEGIAFMRRRKPAFAKTEYDPLAEEDEDN